MSLCASSWPFVSPARADTVALWLFDEQVGVYPGSVLNDAGPKSYFLILGRGAEMVPGKFGNALRPARTDPPTTDAAASRPASLPNATDSKLNLGAHDWTLECWLRLDRGAADEGALFEIGTGSRGENELVSRFSVLPRENAFAFVAVSTGGENPPEIGARRIEYPNPGGPPGGVAIVRTVTLGPGEIPLPRESWIHVALVHAAGSGELRLFIDGKVRSVAVVKINALPHGDEAYVAAGRDGRGQRPLFGAIDELRVSDHAAYAAEFAPPGSFAPRQRGD